MRKKRLDIKINMLEADIITIIAVIVSICGIYNFIKEKDIYNLVTLIISFPLFILSAMSIIVITVITIQSKIKWNRKNLKEFYLKRDITPKDDLFKFTVSFTIMTIMVLLLIIPF